VVSAHFVECEECSKINCHDCIQAWLSKSKEGNASCPTCRAKFNPTKKPNRFVMNKLQELEFNCIRCSKKFKYGQSAAHNIECSEIYFKCPVYGCNKDNLRLSDLEFHFHNECKEITLTCKKCKQGMERDEVIGHNCVETLLKLIDRLKIENNNQRDQALALKEELKFCKCRD
jgi:hypothetical protein